MALSLVLLFASGCALFGEDVRDPGPEGARGSADPGLRTAYSLLEETLAEESKLGALAFLKTVTFSRPVDEIHDLMGRLSKTSRKRVNELEGLRRLEPDVSGDPTSVDPIGQAITSKATEKGMDEMLAREGFGIRFILIQAQATRMVYAISMAAAEREPNRRRREWLRDLAEEYETFRDELVTIIELYIVQQGSAQQK